MAKSLISDLFREAEQAQTNNRAAQQRDLDDAVLLLHDLAGMLIGEEDMPFEPWREAVYEQLPKEGSVPAEY